MTGKDHLLKAIEICSACEVLIATLPETPGKGAFLKRIADQKGVIRGLMERVFFKTPRGVNSASIVLESCEKLDESLKNLAKGPEDARSKRWAEAEEDLQEFVERVEGMVQSAQGKTLAFT